MVRAGILVRLGRILAVVLVLAAAPAAAQTERILAFDAQVTVRPDGVLQVVETIEVVAAGQQIRRGIFRDFPTRSLTPWRFNHRVGFEVAAVERDGRPEPWFAEPLSAGVRIYLGSPDVLLAPGRHRYTIAYETTRQLLQRPGEDELYWNVTGDAWAFPIDRASATVQLPPGAAATAVAGYTGPAGARGTDFEVLRRGGGTVSLATTRGLASGEGFTIAVAWPEGAVQRPRAGEEWLAFAVDNRGILLGLALTVALLAYYAIVWHRVGRDPAKGTVIPLFEAPDGLSPVAVGHVWHGGFSGDFGIGRALTVAITSLATKRALTIEEQLVEGTYVLSAGPVADGTRFADEEAVHRALFADGKNFVAIGSAYVPAMGRASSALETAFGGEFGRAYLHRNGNAWLLGALTAAAVVLSSLALDATGEDAWVLVAVLAVFGSAFTAVGLILGGTVLTRWTDAERRGGYQPARSLGELVGAAACLLVVVGLGWFVSDMLAPAAFAAPVVAVPATVAAWYLLKAPTRLGRRTLDAIEGYRLYLSVAEADRLNAAGREPDVTAALFETHLPYAMALGVEQEWSDKVAARLSASLAEPRARRGFEPDWYRGRDGRPIDARTFGGALSRGLGGAAAFAATRPSSRSGGFSGGGSSGGGGGGGGGGGW